MHKRSVITPSTAKYSVGGIAAGGFFGGLLGSVPGAAIGSGVGAVVGGMYGTYQGGKQANAECDQATRDAVDAFEELNSIAE